MRVGALPSPPRPVAVPELPDLEIYAETLTRRLTGQRFAGLELISPFVLRTVEPPPSALVGRALVGVDRLGKRLALHFDGDHHVAVHLMRSGRLRWIAAEAKPPGRVTQAVFKFEGGRFALTEASAKKRASIHVFGAREALEALRPSGIEPLTASAETFDAALLRERRTLKRAFTDPRLVAGVGNAYSDEILFAARLSPLKLTTALDADERRRLQAAMVDVLTTWTARLRAETGDDFPREVTAFRDGFAVHGRHGEPCPVCGDPVQRIVYADSETNYCARCQNQGRLLADRALSRLLREDWPKTLDQLEELKDERRARLGGAPTTDAPTTDAPTTDAPTTDAPTASGATARTDAPTASGATAATDAPTTSGATAARDAPQYKQTTRKGGRSPRI